MYKEGLIVVGLKNQFFLNYFLWFKHFLKDSSRSCLAAMTFGAQALRLLNGCMWIEGRLDMSWKENGGMLVSKPLKGEEWSGSPNHFWSQAGNLSGRRVVCVSRKPSLRGHFVTWTSFKLRVKVRLGQRNKIAMFNIKITRFRVEISISSLYLIPHNIVLIAFPPSPPLRVYQPNWPFFWKSRAYTVFDLGSLLHSFQLQIWFSCRLCSTHEALKPPWPPAVCWLLSFLSCDPLPQLYCYSHPGSGVGENFQGKNQIGEGYLHALLATGDALLMRNASI